MPHRNTLVLHCRKRLQRPRIISSSRPWACSEGARLRRPRLRQLAGESLNPDPKVDVRWGEQTWQEMHNRYHLLGVFRDFACGAARNGSSRNYFEIPRHSDAYGACPVTGFFLSDPSECSCNPVRPGREEHPPPFKSERRSMPSVKSLTRISGAVLFLPADASIGARFTVVSARRVAPIGPISSFAFHQSEIEIYRFRQPPKTTSTSLRLAALRPSDLFIAARRIGQFRRCRHLLRP